MTGFDGPYINPKCPECGRCIGVHWDEEFEEYYCPRCQTNYSPRKVVR